MPQLVADRVFRAGV